MYPKFDPCAYLNFRAGHTNCINMLCFGSDKAGHCGADPALQFCLIFVLNNTFFVYQEEKHFNQKSIVIKKNNKNQKNKDRAHFVF